jgi:hypothetical protein
MRFKSSYSSGSWATRQPSGYVCRSIVSMTQLPMVTVSPNA